MRDGLTLIDYRLGGPDAWERDEQLSLPENFLPIKQFAELATPTMTFLCGRRGSGKSAIARMLELGHHWAYSKAFQGERSEYGEYMNIVEHLAHARDLGAPVNVRQAVRRLWSWALPVVAMQTVVLKASQFGDPPDPDLLEMQEYLESLPFNITAESSIGYLLSTTFDEAAKHVREGHLDSYLLGLSNSPKCLSAIKALQRKTKTKPTLVVLDTLESYRIFQDSMVEGLQGVLEAIIAFLADERLHEVSVKFFIPAEIFDEVIADFPGKIHPRVVFMRWRAADLIAMLARRFLNVLAHTESLQADDLARLRGIVGRAYTGRDGRHLRTQFWYENEFLPSRIQNQVGNEEDTFAYILRHTMRRPRDLITAQMQAIVDESVVRGEFPKISAASVVRGVHNTDSLEQILGEALTLYEDKFSSAFIASARAAFFNRPIVMDGRELKRFAKELYFINTLENVKPEDFATMLLRCGVIGLLTEQSEKEERHPTPYRLAKFAHLMQTDLPLSDRLRYCVHPVMANLFQMQRFPDGRVVYPEPIDDLWLEESTNIVPKR